jgi:hypothetical protein
MKILRFQETVERSLRRSEGYYPYAWTLWMIGGYGNEFAWPCQAVGFPQYKRMSHVERETMMMGWLEQIEVLVHQPIAGQLVGIPGCKTMLMLGASTVKELGEGKYHEMLMMDAWGEVWTNDQKDARG